MNSTEEQQNRMQDEAGSSKQLSNADTNANLTNQNKVTTECKGAIPKTKPAVKIKANSTKKTIKLNNNIEEITVLNCKMQNDMLRLNGITNGLSNSYLKSMSSEATNVSDSDVIVTNNCEHKTEAQTSTVNCDINPVIFLSSEPCCSSNKNMDQVLGSSDDEDSLSISDDGCIYTYKGDQVADLPTSFFSLDMPPIESPKSPSRQNSSPEMDFLEMDFDPGPSGEADSDSISNDDIETTENLPEDKIQSEDTSKTETKSVNLKSNPETNISIVTVKEIEKKLDILPGPSNIPVKKPDLNNISAEKNHTKLFKNHKRMPWACSMSERTTAPTDICLSRKYHCSKGDVISPSEFIPVKSPKTNSENCCEYLLIKDTQEQCDLNKNDDTIMIWSEQEAYSKHVSQIGPSACGATAVLNVLSALRFAIPQTEKINEYIKTRLRDNNGKLCDYLLSRSVAGTTHTDIIDCLYKISDGHIFSRFFHMYPERIVNLNSWLCFWIKKGAVPIATINLQKCVTGTIPDAWHHQMIFGVCPRGIFLTNPVECIDASHLWSQLTSESTLLIRREDVLNRWNLKTDLPELMKIKDYRWRKANVVGQVANLIYESKRELRFGFRNTSHIKIPAAYSSGITLAIPTSSPGYSLLSQCPELPLLIPKNTSTALSTSAH